MMTPQETFGRTMTNLSNFHGNFNLDKSGFNPNMPGHVTSHQMITRQQPRTVKQIGAGWDEGTGSLSHPGVGQGTCPLVPKHRRALPA